MASENLTPGQIEAISAVLHEHIQFYDEQGQESNDTVLHEIEDVLKAFPLSDVD